MEHTNSSFLLSHLEKQVEGSLYQLAVLEPFNSLVNHLQSLFIILTRCVMIRWSCQSSAHSPGAATAPTQVTVDIATNPPQLLPPAMPDYRGASCHRKPVAQIRCRHGRRRDSPEPPQGVTFVLTHHSLH